MREFLEFCLLVLSGFVKSLFDLDIGGYSFGAFLTACIVLSVFVSSLVVRFRSNDVQSVTRPPKMHGSSGSSKK